MVSAEENTDTSHVGQVRSRSSASNGGAYSSPSGVRLDLPPAAKEALVNRLNSLEEANGAERWTSVLLLSELDSEDDNVRSSIISWRNNDCIKHRFSAEITRRPFNKLYDRSMQISIDKIIVSLLSNPVSGNDFIIETFSLKNTTTHIRILDGAYVLYQVGSPTKRKYSKGKLKNLTVSLYSCGQYKQGSTGIRFDFELDFTRIQKSDVIADDVAIMLREANLSLGEPTQLDSMVMAINRLEGVEQDDTNRAIAMLVDAGRITPREGMLLAVRHAKQR